MRIIITATCVLVAATLTLAADAPAEEGPGFVTGLLETIESHREELRRIEAGQTGVNGYAVFGNDPPKDLMTGDITVDQIYSAPARVKILKAEIDVAYRALILTTADAMGWEIEPYGKHLQTMDIPEMEKELPKLAGVPDAYGDDLFVLSMTQAILHRQPTSDDVADAVKKLKAPNYTRDHYVTELFKSKDYKQAKRTDEEYIIDVLQATAGRRPETGDLPAWKQKLGSNRHAFLQSCLAEPPKLGQGGTRDNDESHDSDGPKIVRDDSPKIIHRPMDDDGAKDSDTPKVTHTDPEKLTWSVLVRDRFGGEDTEEDKWPGWDLSHADDTEAKDGRLEWQVEEDGEYVVYDGKAIPMDNVEIEFRGWCTDSGFRVLVVGQGGIVGAALGDRENTESFAFLGTDNSTVGRQRGKVWKKKEWHTYKIRRVGNTVEAWCDGRKIVSGTGQTGRGTGKLMFSGMEGDYKIDDLVIRTAK